MKTFKIILLHILSFVLNVAPVLIYFFINIDVYVKTGTEAFKITFGGIILITIVVIKLIGKLKIPSGIIWYGIVFILSYLLQAILRDLMIFSFLALIGEIMSLIVEAIIKKLKNKSEGDASAPVTAEEIEKIIEKHSGGRV